MPRLVISSWYAQFSRLSSLLPKSSELRTQNPYGFTLVELMVAIAIVAVLATVGFVIFTNTQKNARDTRRRGDLDAISNAFEGHYLPIAGTCDGQLTPSTQPTYCALQKTWFTSKTVPLDPLGTGKQKYCMTQNNDSTVIDDLTINTWANANTCPTDWVEVLEKIPDPATVANFNSWKVCTYFESQKAILCKGSQQL